MCADGNLQLQCISKDVPSLTGYSFIGNRDPPIFIIFTARCDASAVFAVMQCLSVRSSVRPYVTFVDHVKTNKHIFEIFSPSGSDTILVFPSQRGCRYSDGASNARGV